MEQVNNFHLRVRYQIRYVASKLYVVDVTIIIFVFVFYCIVSKFL